MCLLPQSGKMLRFFFISKYIYSFISTMQKIFHQCVSFRRSEKVNNDLGYSNKTEAFQNGKL